MGRDWRRGTQIVRFGGCLDCQGGTGRHRVIGLPIIVLGGVRESTPPYQPSVAPPQQASLAATPPPMMPNIATADWDQGGLPPVETAVPRRAATSTGGGINFGEDVQRLPPAKTQRPTCRGKPAIAVRTQTGGPEGGRPSAPVSTRWSFPPGRIVGSAPRRARGKRRENREDAGNSSCPFRVYCRRGQAGTNGFFVDEAACFRPAFRKSRQFKKKQKPLPGRLFTPPAWRASPAVSTCKEVRFPQTSATADAGVFLVAEAIGHAGDVVADHAM